MAITEVTVNHMEQNYFHDYREIRTDRMTGVTTEKVSRAIDRLVRRYRNSGECDCLFVTNDNGTGWRLTYDFDPKLFERGVARKYLRLRHYTYIQYDSWDTEETVSVARAKECILGMEQQ